jgi:rare lipoprotein A
LAAALLTGMGSSSSASAQDWPFWAPYRDGPGKDRPRPYAPTSISSWRTTVSHEPSEGPPAVTSPWRTTVVYSKAPLLVANPIPRAAPRPDNPLTGKPHVLEGIASFYWQDQITATGERFDRTAMTAAHRTLPFNSRVRVTNVVNGRSVVVRINDRGPYKPGRIIDISEAAATLLDMNRLGVVAVKLQVISN